MIRLSFEKLCVVCCVLALEGKNLELLREVYSGQRFLQPPARPAYKLGNSGALPGWPVGSQPG